MHHAHAHQSDYLLHLQRTKQVEYNYFFLNANNTLF